LVVGTKTPSEVEIAGLTYFVKRAEADTKSMMFLFSFDWPSVADYLFVRIAALLGASYLGVVAIVWVESRIERFKVSPAATVAPGHTIDSSTRPST
jgi:hypothetical protein